MSKHPGKTKAQRAVLDAIGCGDFCPRMTRQTRDALLKAGLIREAGYRVLGKDRFGEVRIPEYSMPLPVHIAWCEAMAEECDAPRAHPRRSTVRQKRVLDV